jgi:hypothetical protein
VFINEAVTKPVPATVAISGLDDSHSPAPMAYSLLWPWHIMESIIVNAGAAATSMISSVRQPFSAI